MRRILKWCFMILVLALFVWFEFAYWTSTNNCGAASASLRQSMKAIVRCEYGPPSVLHVQQIEKPAPEDNQVLVKVRAFALNPLDWHYVEGTPKLMRVMGIGLRKPKDIQIGVDYSGVVEAVGQGVTNFKPGDEVYGGHDGAFAEYVCARADKAIAFKPANISFEQAASVPIAGLTALQAVRDKGKVQAGNKVLINGASGGVGTFAVQIAKNLGANVTAVCSGRNADLVRKLGADQVIDYTKDDFTKGDQRYDVIIDNVCNKSLRECRRVLTEKGIDVIIGGGGVNDQGIIGPLVTPFKALLFSPFVSQKFGMMLANLNQKDLTTFAELMQSGKVTPVIDKTYKFDQISDAMQYLELGHARGKIVVTMD